MPTMRSVIVLINEHDDDDDDEYHREMIYAQFARDKVHNRWANR